MHILRVLPLRGALPAQPVQDGASAVYAKAVFLPDVRQQFLTHAAPQMRQLSAGEALEMEVLAAIRFADILIYEAFLPFRTVFPDGSVRTQRGKLTVKRALPYRSVGIPRAVVQAVADLLNGELLIRMSLQKGQQALPALGSVRSHVAPPSVSDRHTV
jgi:hypothetical protein